MAMMKCAGCGRTVEPRGIRCPYCDTDLRVSVGEDSKPVQRQIAIRLDEENVVQAINGRAVNVPDGSRAVLMRDGGIEQILQPGRHQLQSLGEQISNWFTKRQLEVILVHSADLTLSFRFGTGAETVGQSSGMMRRLIAADQLEVGVEIQIRLTVDQPELLVRQMMVGRSVLTSEDLRQACMDPVAMALQSVVPRHPAADLTSRAEICRETEGVIEQQVTQLLSVQGIRLVKVDALGFFSEKLEEKRQGEVHLWDLGTAEALASRQDEIERDGVTREVMRDLFEKRTDAEKFEITNQLIEKKMLSKQNFDLVRRAIEDEAQDHALARAFFEEKTAQLNQQELNTLNRQHNLESARFDEQETDIHFDGGLSRQDKDHTQKVTEDERDWGLARRIREERLALDLKEKEENKRINRDDDLGRAEHKARLIGEMSAQGPEALMAYLDDAGRARMLTELRKTEVLKGFSEEQILAMSAENSSAVADALKEKFKNMGSARVEDMYQKMLDDKSGFAVQLQAMFGKALDSQSSSVVGVAHGSGPKAGGFMGMPLAGGAEMGQGGGAVMLCPKCNAQNPPSYNFCGNCGEKLRGV